MGNVGKRPMTPKGRRGVVRQFDSWLVMQQHRIQRQRWLGRRSATLAKERTSEVLQELDYNVTGCPTSMSGPKHPTLDQYDQGRSHIY